MSGLVQYLFNQFAHTGTLGGLGGATGAAGTASGLGGLIAQLSRGLGLGLALNPTTLADATTASDAPPQTLYHGTDLGSAMALVAGTPLSAEIAAQRKIWTGSPIGFYMTPDIDAASHFAALHSVPGLIAIDISNTANRALIATNQVVITNDLQVGKYGPTYSQILVLPGAFPVFDAMRAAGEIRVRLFGK